MGYKCRKAKITCTWGKNDPVYSTLMYKKSISGPNVSEFRLDLLMDILSGLTLLTGDVVGDGVRTHQLEVCQQEVLDVWVFGQYPYRHRRQGKG